MGLKLDFPGAFVLLLSCTLVASQASNSSNIFDVKNYGAISDGKTDNAQAFQSAWNQACSLENGSPIVLIPEGSFLIGPVIFRGPCKSLDITFQVNGVVLASSDLNDYQTSNWIQFRHINGCWSPAVANLTDKVHCHGHTIPSLTFGSVTDSVIQDISSVNSKNFHMHVFSCKNLTFQRLKITAPGDSPNTDGMHISKSSNITVSSLFIGTGDDCISFGPGSKNISISDVFCGPGHGISIGSLGKYANEEDVERVSVTNCTFVGTTNGVRIKTWQKSGASSASNLTFENIVIKNVDNPIVIDQKYCPHNTCGQDAPSKVKISNVKYKNIRGSSTKEVAVSLFCSKAAPCENIKLVDINLTFNGTLHAVANCSNAQGTSAGFVNPRSCF